jgi:hypothetical protein
MESIPDLFLSEILTPLLTDSQANSGRCAPPAVAAKSNSSRTLWKCFQSMAYGAIVDGNARARICDVQFFGGARSL